MAVAVGIRRIMRTVVPEDDLDMADSDFYREVVAAFRGLLDSGYYVESSTYSARAFGNAQVTIAGHGLRIRMSRDRGDTQADVLCGADPDRSYDWHPLEWVIAAASGSVPPGTQNDACAGSG